MCTCTIALLAGTYTIVITITRLNTFVKWYLTMVKVLDKQRIPYASNHAGNTLRLASSTRKSSIGCSS